MEELTTTPTPIESGPRQLGGIRRAAATALLAVGLLVVGGVAAVSAADPSASPAPSGQVEGTDGTDAGATEGTEREGRPGCDGDKSTPEEESTESTS